VGDEYTFTIDAKPQVKQRPRMSRRGKVYTPAKTRDYEQLVGTFYDGPKFETPVAMRLEFTTKYTTVTLTPVDKPENYLRGDLTNYVKAVEDGLNGIAYLDDHQIVRVEAWRL
jgi:crossover junction endodeoxyribonuclease RusA